MKCSKYVDMSTPLFKGKSELEIWLTLQPEHQQWVFYNELLATIKESIAEAIKVGETTVSDTSSGLEDQMPPSPPHQSDTATEE